MTDWKSVEQDIANAVKARVAPPAAPRPGLATRIEDAAVRHMRSIAFGGAGAVLSIAATLMIPNTAPPVATDPIIVGSIVSTPRVASPPAWQVVRNPIELVALQAPQFQRDASEYYARSSVRGDREDSLIFEPGRADAPEARITLRRSPASTGEPPSLFIDMTRQQAERGVAVTRAGTPGLMPTKFGEVEVADMTFADSSGQSQSCLAFRQSGAIGLSGWYCGAIGDAVERPELACFIDRLSLLKAGEDRDLRRYFAEAEQRRVACPTTRLSTGRKPTWLDSDGRPPAMRDITGSIGGTPRR